MTIDHVDRRARLSIDIEPELRKRLKIAAAEKEMSVREYVVGLLKQALAAEERSKPAEEEGWARLSARSFARDWASAEDQVYDALS